jgi:hypothetical protein
MAVKELSLLDLAVALNEEGWLARGDRFYVGKKVRAERILDSQLWIGRGVFLLHRRRYLG